ncbi:serine O-acetyltransferase [Wenyingzhuangia heitensis]|uniref:Serine O-acetyltransferase n=1 Tax=Wenyingzhuangia heitensis TaxID=1487859 RepID=A0ABX0U6N0_9FLAO|nr:serine O-acetyltransferase EpsC [Wenyingzhuangia heitensis]NIJ44512.1 serine O-acetyltransferase [Wenyingzhuangia heitensis]
MKQIIEQLQNIKQNTDLNYSVKTSVEDFTQKIFSVLFDDSIDLANGFKELELLFKKAAKISCASTQEICDKAWIVFAEKLPSILKDLNKDATYFMESDPAARRVEEIYFAYPGFYAIAIHRLSHEIYNQKLYLFARLMSEYAHRLTGTDIHPGATIYAPVFIDHATGIVIGETCIIEPNVKIYQGVTLGALSVSKDKQDTKRHPTVKSNVCIYANATILGGETIVGENSIIGGNVWVTKSVPSNSVVYNTIQANIKSR